ncbi:MAG: two-component system LytT family response regulator [Bacteroidia bacterium]|jgi:two-component system LytT family response regulator
MNEEIEHQIIPIDDNIMLENGNKSIFVKLRHIHMITSDSDYIIFHVGSNTIRVIGSLNNAMKRLDPKQFFRADRQSIINVDFISSLVSGNDTIWIEVTCGNQVEKITTSRRQGQAFRKQFQIRFYR